MKDTCHHHLEGEVSFLLANMVINVGFALMQCANDEFCPLEPSLDTYDKILRDLGLEISWVKSELVCYITNAFCNNNRVSVHLQADMVDLLCVIGSAMLVSLHEKVKVCFQKASRSHWYQFSKPVVLEEYHPARCQDLGSILAANAYNIMRFSPHSRDLGIFVTGL